MEVKEFLRSKLSALAAKFRNVTMVYAYNSLAETHIVQLTPQQDYYNNRDLDKAWFEISCEFADSFPYESISFVSDDAKLITTEPEFQFNILMMTAQTMDNTFYENIVNSTLKKYWLNYSKEFTTNFIPQLTGTFEISDITGTDSEIDGDGDYSYAMAA